MGNFLQAILKLFQSLFGGSKPVETPQTACSVFDVEIPPAQDYTDLPFFGMEEARDGILDVSAQAVQKSCKIQVRPSLGRVNVRGGPRLQFGTIALTEGGTRFDLQGASEADPDGYRWYTIKTPVGAGWLRGDTVIIGEDCLTFTFIDRDDLTPPELPSPNSRFPLPIANAEISQFYSQSHRALDLVSDIGTQIRAVTTGLVIRKVDCSACAEHFRPNFSPPCGDWLLQSPDWGYGYGNFVVVRHQYASMPPPMRAEMDGKGLTGGFVYILYAHFSENRVETGDTVNAGDLLGLTGNHGCSSAPHLHFEVRIGRDEIIDGVWQQQIAVNPNLVFDM